MRERMRPLAHTLLLIALLLAVLLPNLLPALLVECTANNDAARAVGNGQCTCDIEESGGEEQSLDRLLEMADQLIAQRDLACSIVCLQRAVALSFESRASQKSVRSNDLPGVGGRWSEVALVLQRLTRLLYAQRQVAAAAASQQLVARLLPTDGEARRGLGQLRRELGDLRGATAAFSHALVLEPNNPSFMYSLASLLQQSEVVGTGGKGRHPRHADASRQLRAAELLYREALRIRPTIYDAANNLGNLLRERGNVEEALLLFARAVGGAPGNAHYLLNFGSALVSLRRFRSCVHMPS
jgi:tetratricopeptide (TPR) repeat protein